MGPEEIGLYAQCQSLTVPGTRTAVNRAHCRPRAPLGYLSSEWGAKKIKRCVIREVPAQPRTELYPQELLTPVSPNGFRGRAPFFSTLLRCASSALRFLR